MKFKHLTILTLVFAMMVALVGVVAAQDDAPNGRRGKHNGRGLLGNSTIITDATGLTEVELRTALRDGSTIAELIEANDGDVDTVIAALVAEVTNNLTDKVEAGNITQERADTILETLEEHITERVNGTFERPDRDRDGRRGRRGFNGDNTDTDDTETSTESA